MKGAKLVDIFRNGNIVVPLFFLKNHKRFNLELDEFLFLMYLYNLGDKVLFDPNRYSEVLNIDLENIMKYIGILTDKGYIQVEILKNEKGLMEEFVLLDGFFQKLALLTMEEVNQESNIVDSNIFNLIEKEFGRTLGPIEIEIIKAWLNSNMSEELIIEAIKEAVLNGVSNLRYIDKILYEWGKNDIKTVADVEKMRKKRNDKIDASTDNDIDMDIVDWNWFDEDE